MCLDDAAEFKLSKRFGNGICGNFVIAGDCPDAFQFAARGKISSVDSKVNLVDDLLVHGDRTF